MDIIAFASSNPNRRPDTLRRWWQNRGTPEDRHTLGNLILREWQKDPETVAFYAGMSPVEIMRDVQKKEQILREWLVSATEDSSNIPHVAPSQESENPADSGRKVSTVAEIIAALQQMPQDLPVFVRPKYWGRAYGPMETFESAPVAVSGISKMEGHATCEKDGFPVPRNVTFLV